jgi:hypothetical protein
MQSLLGVGLTLKMRHMQDILSQAKYDKFRSQKWGYTLWWVVWTAVEKCAHAGSRHLLTSAWTKYAFLSKDKLTVAPTHYTVFMSDMLWRFNKAHWASSLSRWVFEFQFEWADSLTKFSDVIKYLAQDYRVLYKAGICVKFYFNT